VEPISTALTGLALVQQGVDFVKKNINTAQDIGQIFGMVDAALNGRDQINKSRWGNKSLLGQHKDAANAVIDAKLAEEQIEEMKNLIDYRFGFGTWQEILQLRAQRIREEREEAERIARQKRKNQQEIKQILMVFGIGLAVILVVILGVAIFLK
tara:strand:- start:679 stop:1140 length:462 start_codon:yes stop_codon:yes gene_type:complete